MAYSPTVWTDRAVSTPNTYTKSGETSSEVTLVAKPGTVTQAGTAINASNMNKIETGLVSATSTADAALPKAGGTVTGPITYQGEVLPQMRKNATNGLLEYYDGTGWIAVGATLTYEPSTTVQFLDATQRNCDPGLNASKSVLVGIWTPTYDGFINVSGFLSSTNNAQTSLTVQSYTFGRYNSSSTSQPMGSTTLATPASYPFNRFIPLGTVIAPWTGAGAEGVGGASVGATGSSTSTTVTVTVNANIAVFAGVTLYFLVQATGNSGQNGPAFVKNLTIKFDKMVGDGR